jgi:predicted exporter
MKQDAKSITPSSFGYKKISSIPLLKSPVCVLDQKVVQHSQDRVSSSHSILSEQLHPIIRPQLTLSSHSSNAHYTPRSHTSSDEQTSLVSTTTLQLLQTQLLQWCVINARAEGTFVVKRRKAEQLLYTMSENISHLRFRLMNEQKYLDHVRYVNVLHTLINAQVCISNNKLTKHTLSFSFSLSYSISE